MEFLILIPTIYLLAMRAEIDRESRSDRKRVLKTKQYINHFSNEHREKYTSLEEDINILDDTLNDNKWCIIFNTVNIFWYITITCAILVFWDYDSVISFSITRVSFLSMFITMGFDIYQRKKLRDK